MSKAIEVKIDFDMVHTAYVTIHDAENEADAIKQAEEVLKLYAEDVWGGGHRTVTVGAREVARSYYADGQQTEPSEDADVVEVSTGATLRRIYPGEVDE
jgi:hypothetical protein